MAYDSCVFPGLFVLRWGEKPETSDVIAYADEIKAVRDRQHGRRPAGLIIMPENSAPPDEQFRAAQAERLPEIMINLSLAVCVFEGTGFRASLKRSALIAITLLSPQRHRIYVRASVEEALVRNPPPSLNVDTAVVLETLARRNFVNRATVPPRRAL